MAVEWEAGFNAQHVAGCQAARLNACGRKCVPNGFGKSCLDDKFKPILPGIARSASERIVPGYRALDGREAFYLRYILVGENIDDFDCTRSLHSDHRSSVTGV